MIIFVGDRPSPRMKPGAKAFRGAACEFRLYKWIHEVIGNTLVNAVAHNLHGALIPSGVNPSLTAYDVINWSDSHFPEYAAKFLNRAKFVAIGNNAAHVLNLAGIPHFKLPHPSGRNRQNNDPDFIQKRLDACKEWLKNG